MSNDVKEYIEENNLDDICVMGHSLGGKVAMALAAYNPKLHNKIKKFAIIDILPIDYL